MDADFRTPNRIPDGIISPRHAFPVVAFFLALSVTLGVPASAQTGGGATITGTVANATDGQFLNLARVSVKGSAVETFTDPLGGYRLNNVPPGEVTLQVFFTGLDPQQATFPARAGETVRKDFTLTREGTETEITVKLDPYVVATNREFNAAAIAINEQRFAPNIKSVLSVEEVGEIGDANVGEFIKLLPGVSANDSVGSVATDIAIRGFSAAATSLTIDGAEAASAGAGGTNRQVDLTAYQMLNNVARVEVLKTPTPDTPANMLGGSVNIVSKSAFERSKPMFSYRLGGSWMHRVPIGDWPSPGKEKRMQTVRPSVDFSYVAPVSKSFGFTINGAYNSRFLLADLGDMAWNRTTLMLTQYSLLRSPQVRDAASLGFTADWRFAENDVLSASFSHADAYADTVSYTHIAAIGAGSPTGSPTFTQSDGTRGSATARGAMLIRHDQTWNMGLKWRHMGPVWKIDGNTYYSFAKNKIRNMDKGSVSSSTATISGLSVRFDDIGGPDHPGPGVITARNAAGVLVDIDDVRNYNLTQINDGRRTGTAVKRGGQLNARRTFDFGLPVELKAGVFFNQEVRDNRSDPLVYSFVGPDGIANNADNRIGLYDFVAEEMSSVAPPYGFPAKTYISPYKIYDYFKANPNQFVLNEVAAISGKANASTEITETVSAAYVRGDVRLLDNKMWVVGGVRFERTEDEGRGVLNDLRNTYQQDANGNLILDAAGRPIRKTTNAVELARLQFAERGAYAKRSYTGYFPSININYNVSTNVIARLAYAKTIGRPQYSNIIPGVTVTDPASTTQRITVRNTGLKPWSADAYDFSLESYFGKNGVASVGLFRKEISDFFGATSETATSELLEQYGLTDEYLGYDVVSTTNIGDATISGLELNYRHALEFLPQWARGIRVFGNGTFLDLDGGSAADFNQFVKRTLSYGVSLNRPRFSVNLNWNSKGPIRGNVQAPEAHFWIARRTTLDASFEIRIHKNASLFGAARNLNNRRHRRERYGPETPSFAHNNRYIDVGAHFLFGVKGSF